MELKEHVFEPQLFTEENKHKRVQCIYCRLREHNPVHVPPPKPEPLPEAVDQDTYDRIVADRERYNACL